MRRHWWVRLLGMTPLVGLLAVGAIVQRPTSAYNDYDLVCGWSYSGGYNLLYIPYGTDPDFPPYGSYTTAISSAIDTWNGTATPIYFYSTGTGGTHTVGVKDGGANGRAGWLAYGCSNYRSWSALYLNSYYLDSGSDFTRVGVASHELGHFLGLGHSYYTAIMGQNDGSFNSPRVDDICGTNVMYPSIPWPATCGY